MANATMNSVLFPSINNLKMDKFDATNLEYVILQEKLDGCNFRIIFNRNEPTSGDDSGKIQFGSRTVLLDEKTSFHGYQRIAPQLIASTKAVADRDELRGKSFIIFGELVGYRPGGKPIIDRFEYFKDTKVIKYFAYEIFVEKDPNTVAVPVQPESENEREPELALPMEFFKAQQILTEANFDVIPYTILDAADFSYEKITNFESIYFDHKDFVRMEGYVLRFKFKDVDQLTNFKLKPEMLPEFKVKLDQLASKKQEKKNTVQIDDKFIDYISKVPYLDDDQKLDPKYYEICLEEYQKETKISTKKDFGVFYRCLTEYGREKPNFNELFKKFNQLVKNGGR